MSCILGIYGILSIFNKSGFFLQLRNDFSSLILTHGVCLGIFYTIQKNRYISYLLFQFVFCILSIFIVSRTIISYKDLYFIQIICIILFTIVFNVVLSYASGIFHYFIILYALVTVYLFSFTVRLSIETSVSSFFFVLSVLAIITSLGRRISWRVIRGGVYLFEVAFCGALWSILAGAAIYLHNMNNTALPGEAKQPIFLLSVDEVSAFFQTSVRECLEFFYSFYSGSEKVILFVSFLIGALLVGLTWRGVGRGDARKGRWATILIFASSVVLFFTSNPLIGPVSQIKAIQQSYAQITEEFTRQRQLRSERGGISATKAEQGELYIIVLGESSNKRHWSAWGYVRNTTPWTMSLRQDKNTIFFENAYSSYCHTVPSLIKALTKSNQYNGITEFDAPSLMEVSRAAGFNVVWLSNQDKITLLDNPLTVLSLDANQTKFTTRSRFSSDADLFPLLDQTLASLDYTKNNLVILHTIGSHFDYSRRIPHGFQPEFPRKEEFLGNWARDGAFLDDVLDPYDRTVRFTDEFLRAVHERMEKTPAKVRLLCYAADHGEDVFGRRFHNAASFTYDMARIPMFIQFSPAYAEKYAVSVNMLRERRTAPFTLDLFYNAMLSLMAVHSVENDSQYDILSPNYAISWENAVTMKADKTLDSRFYATSEARLLRDDPLVVERENLKHLQKVCPDKLLAAIHCDALGAAQQVLTDGFRGLEVNINAPDMRIGHAPELVYDMALDEFLSRIDLNKVDILLLDMKNVRDEDIDSLLKNLNELDKYYNLKNRTIVESSFVTSNMKKISRYGWNTCYYLAVKRWSGDNYTFGLSSQFESIIKNMAQKDDQKLCALAHEISDAIRQQESKSFSFWGYAYPFVKKYVEPLLDDSITYNVFAIPGAEIMSSRNMHNFNSNPVMRDPRVRVILVSGDTNFVISDPSAPPA